MKKGAGWIAVNRLLVLKYIFGMNEKRSGLPPADTALEPLPIREAPHGDEPTDEPTDELTDEPDRAFATESGLSRLDELELRSFPFGLRVRNVTRRPLLDLRLEDSYLWDLSLCNVRIKTDLSLRSCSIQRDLSVDRVTLERGSLTYRDLLVGGSITEKDLAVGQNIEHDGVNCRSLSQLDIRAGAVFKQCDIVADGDEED